MGDQRAGQRHEQGSMAGGVLGRGLADGGNILCVGRQLVDRGCEVEFTGNSADEEGN